MVKKLIDITQYLAANILMEFRFLLPSHIQEQVIYRRRAASACYNNGACINCGCKMPEYLYRPIGCEHNCFFRFRTKWNWKLLKIFKMFDKTKILFPKAKYGETAEFKFTSLEPDIKIISFGVSCSTCTTLKWDNTDKAFVGTITFDTKPLSSNLEFSTKIVTINVTYKVNGEKYSQNLEIKSYIYDNS